MYAFIAVCKLQLNNNHYSIMAYQNCPLNSKPEKIAKPHWLSTDRSIKLDQELSCNTNVMLFNSSQLICHYKSIVN